MKILAIDTSSAAASAALCDDEKIVAEFYTDAKLTHSQTLMAMTESLLSATMTSIEDIGLYAVSTGPGSFTGLRIGIAAVKGMAFAANRRCVGVSTLLGLGYNLLGCSGTACAVMDARRGQVYTALFALGAEITRLTPDMAVPLDTLKTQLKNIQNKIILVGDGAHLCYNHCKDALADVRVAKNTQLLQHASSVAMIALADSRRGITLSPDELRPSYLRLPQAERERMEAGKTEIVNFGSK